MNTGTLVGSVIFAAVVAVVVAFAIHLSTLREASAWSDGLL